MIFKTMEVLFQALTNCVNQSIISRSFMDSLKVGNISPAYKTKDL